MSKAAITTDSVYSMNENEYHKTTFTRIPADKQQRILDAAIQEFAGKGYNAASINIIARNAGISIGSMYSYFASKEDLFMSVMDSGHNLLEQALKEVVDMPGDLYDRMDKMIEVSQRYAIENHQLNQIYIEISTEGLSHLARRISLKMESLTAAIYHRLIDEAKTAGLVAKNLDSRALSFFLDNLVMMVQFSYSSDYYRERLKVYAGENSYNDPASLRAELMKFIRNGLLPRV